MAALIAAVRGVETEPRLAEAISAQTGGNPFLAEAVAGQLVPPGEAGGRRQGHRDPFYGSGMPTLVREAIAHRVAALGPAATPVLEVAAVIGQRFDGSLLAEVGEFHHEEVVRLLHSAVAGGLLSEVPQTLDTFTFVHPLYRETIYRWMPRGSRTALHRRITDALRSREGRDPRDISELARHLAGAGPALASQALEYGVRAGAGALGARSFEDAIGHYSDALSALDASGSPDESLRCELLLALGEAEWRVGDQEASRETFSSVARIARSLDDDDALARSALGFSGFGRDGAGSRNSDALRLLESALERAGLSNVRRSRLLSRLADVLRLCEQPGRAEGVSGEALELAESTGNADTIVAALVARWYTLRGSELAEERIAVPKRLAELLPRVRDRDVEVGARFLRVLASLEVGDFAEVDIAIAEHSRIAEQLKAPTARLHSRAFMVMRSLMEGQFADAERQVMRVLELGTAARTAEGVEYSGFELAMLRWEQGRLTEMEEPVRDLVTRFERAPVWRAILATLLVEGDREADARAELERVTARSLDDGVGGADLPAACFAAVAAIRLGDNESVGRLYQTLAPSAGRMVVAGGAAIYASTVSHHLGVLATALGDLESAVAHLEDAVAVNERAGALPWLARARFDLAEALARRAGKGDSERAGKLLADASRTAEELGMGALLGRMGRGEEPSSLASQAG